MKSASGVALTIRMYTTKSCFRPNWPWNDEQFGHEKLCQFGIADPAAHFWQMLRALR